jgi:hypothetical protein
MFTCDRKTADPGQHSGPVKKTNPVVFFYRKSGTCMHAILGMQPAAVQIRSWRICPDSLTRISHLRD